MKIRSIGIPLPIENIDTDQIIPAAFLKRTDQSGYGEHLFHNWRYDSSGGIEKNFILNTPPYDKGEIIIAGHNFGCGSSREHAAWALKDFGIRAVISTQIADIHKGNQYNNGIIPIELKEKKVSILINLTKKLPNAIIEIDLETQSIIAPEIKFKASFDIHPFKKECLMSGVDETEYLIQLKNEIEQFENTRNDL